MMFFICYWCCFFFGASGEFFSTLFERLVRCLFGCTFFLGVFGTEKQNKICSSLETDSQRVGSTNEPSSRTVCQAVDGSRSGQHPAASLLFFWSHIPVPRNFHPTQIGSTNSVPLFIFSLAGEKKNDGDGQLLFAPPMRDSRDAQPWVMRGFEGWDVSAMGTIPNLGCSWQRTGLNGLKASCFLFKFLKRRNIS